MRVSLSLLLITDEDSVVSHGGRSMGGIGAIASVRGPEKYFLNESENAIRHEMLF